MVKKLELWDPSQEARSAGGRGGGGGDAAAADHPFIATIKVSRSGGGRRASFLLEDAVASRCVPCNYNHWCFDLI